MPLVISFNTIKEVITIKGICYIFAACKENINEINISKKENDIIIAADGGYDILNKNNLSPDIVIGDFDSLESVLTHENVIKHPVEKDETDTFLALKLGLEKGYKNFVIYGGTGGRFDHTIANLQLLLWIAKRGGRAFLIGNDTIITTIFNAKLSFSNDFEGKTSVFAQGNTANEIKISGLKYNADEISLNPEFPLGVSNEFVGERAEISVQDGALLVVWEEKSYNFLNKIDEFII